MIRILGFALALGLVPVGSMAQSLPAAHDAPGVEYELSNPIELSALQGTDLYLEPHLSIDRRSGEMLAAAMVLARSDSLRPRRAVTYESPDGRVWTGTYLTAFDELEPIDVWTAIAPDGVRLVSSLVQTPPTATGFLASVNVLRRDRDAAAWSDAVPIPSGRGAGYFDHPTVTADWSWTETHGFVYLCGHQAVQKRERARSRTAGFSCAVSTDGGLSFAAPGA